MKSIIFDNLAIEENIRKILKEKNLTIKDLSKIMGKNQNTLYTDFRRLQESNKADLNFIVDLAGALGVDYNDLIIAGTKDNKTRWFNGLLQGYYFDGLTLIDQDNKSAITLTEVEKDFLINQLEKVIENYIKKFIDENIKPFND